jgi:[acyl-carrier-protein] S-malonyltransferase
MAAVLGLDIPTLDELCALASTETEIVQVANDNSPGQVVISGSNAALDRLQPLLENAGARRVIRLAVSIAAHSPHMSTSQQDFNQAISATLIKNPLIPIISNVTARPMVDADEIKADLQNQLTHRVRWTESIQYLVSEGVSECYEIGSGSVLSGLVKRIDRNLAAMTLGSPADFTRNQ